MTGRGSGPLEGLVVIEVLARSSDLGLGLAGAAPGMLLGDLGATVTRVITSKRQGHLIDDSLAWSRVWNRHKTVRRIEDPSAVAELMAEADVVFVYGPRSAVEDRGLGAETLRERAPHVAYVRCAPSVVNGVEVGDHALLVEAAAGFCTQLSGHRDGPIFVDARAASSGAAFLLTASALALLHRRQISGRGGSAETTLYDGMLATLGCMIGRPEHGPDDVVSYWRDGSTFPNFLYRCADDELIQVWFGGKGMYPTLLEVLGDEPSEQGYYADQISGQLRSRAERWTELFRARPRDEWLELLRAAGVAAEPVNRPGDALTDPHLRLGGLVEIPPLDMPQRDRPQRDRAGRDRAGRDRAGRDRDGRAGGEGDRAEKLMLRGLIRVEPLVAEHAVSVDHDRGTGPGPDRPLDGPDRPLDGPDLPLDGLRLVDFSAFVAGPFAAQVLADLGADVVKVEPPGGEAMRAAAYAVAACQRGKRSLAMDIGASESRPAVDGLLRWADVVLHNFRVGVAERLGIGADDVADRRPDAVYCHASGFGPSGPRATAPANDALMQALTGFEVANGGEGNPPLAATWIPIDMSGGWLAAIGILAGLVARARDGVGQRVDTSLLGAGMLLHSGVSWSDGEIVSGPVLDAAQTGYGPGYRIYRAADGWIAVVVPDADAWQQLAATTGVELGDYTPLRATRDGASMPDDPAAAAEIDLADAIGAHETQHWLDVLGGTGVEITLVRELDRDRFRSGILDDPHNRDKGRVAAYATPEWGDFEQIGPLLRLDPAGQGPPLQLPGVGEHSVEVLAMVGLDRRTITHLCEAGLVTQAAQSTARAEA